jgi:hypothetical protein
MTNDNLRLLISLRSEVPSPDEATAQRIYRLATTGQLHERGWFAPRMPHPPLGLPQLARRRRLIALSAAAALSLAGLLMALTLSTAAPESAYAAARKAIAATSAGALDSGTMTLTASRDGDPRMGTTTRWNGDDIGIASGGERGMLAGFEQLLLVGGSVYLQKADGSWLHYASESDLAPPLDFGLKAIRGLVAGSRAAQIIASAYGLQKTVQPDGSTIYSGTVPAGEGTEVAPTDDTDTGIIGGLPQISHTSAALQLVVGSDGLVRQMTETADDGSAAWSIEYSQLGSTPPVSPPTSYTEGTPGDLNTGPHLHTGPQEVPADTAPYPVRPSPVP